MKNLNLNRYQINQPIDLTFENLLNTGVLDLNDMALLKNENKYLENYGFLHVRMNYIKKYGFTLVYKDFLDEFASIFKGKKVLEVGAGCGFLAYSLSQYGVDIEAIDKIDLKNNRRFERAFFDVKRGLAEDFLITQKGVYNVVLMSWPEYNTNFAHDILKALEPGQKLVYIGEDYGGCTANNLFFESLEKSHITLNKEETKRLNKNRITWPTIHDNCWVYDILGKQSS